MSTTAKALLEIMQVRLSMIDAGLIKPSFPVIAAIRQLVERLAILEMDEVIQIECTDIAQHARYIRMNTNEVLAVLPLQQTTEIPMTTLILAGIHDSGPHHWQSFWLREDPRLVKLVHASWSHPDRHEWVRELEAGMNATDGEVVLVAHSLACLMVAHWADQAKGRVRGALLVSVPDPDGPNFPADARHFGDLPLTPFPFRSIVVSSDNDPYGSPQHMKRCADAWGSDFVVVSGLGHINADSGLGSWSQGKELLQKLRAA